MTIWDILIALSGIDDYAARVESDGSITIEPISEIEDEVELSASQLALSAP